MLTIPKSTFKHPYLQQGLVVVELAITLPLVLLIMLATAEFGRAFFQYTTLSKAVEAGARYYSGVVLDSTIPDDVAEDTTENLIVFGDPGAGTSILPGFAISDVNVYDIATSGVPNHINVTATYTFKPIIGRLPIYGKIDNITMTASHTLRAL